MSSIISGERFQICTIRKKDLCKCGCKGFCSFYPILRTISWSFNQLAGGIWPEVRHDGVPFEVGSMRHDLGGGLLADGFAGALTEMRADLLEFVGSLGFTESWSDTTTPCFLCDATIDNIFDMPPSVANCRWSLHDEQAYAKKVGYSKIYCYPVWHELPQISQFLTPP